MPVSLLFITLIFVLVDIIQHPDPYECMPSSERYRQEFMK